MSLESWRAAWHMAQLGYRVFPLQDGGKQPRKRSIEDKTQDAEGRGGFYVATTDPETIIFWAKQLPHANYGIACGGELTVLDLDRHSEDQDGIGVLDFWCHHFGGCSINEIISQTFTVNTPSDGLHVYLKGFAAISRTLISGVELQNHGSYVVGPGSCTLKGCYTSDKEPVVPEDLYQSKSWLRKLIDGMMSEKSGVKTSTTKMNIQQCMMLYGCVPEGYRHDAVYMELVFMLGYDEMEQYDAFLKIQELIETSFEGENVFSENEIKRNIKNALRHLKIEPERWLFDE